MAVVIDIIGIVAATAIIVIDTAKIVMSIEMLLIVVRIITNIVI